LELLGGSALLISYLLTVVGLKRKATSFCLCGSLSFLWLAQGHAIQQTKKIIGNHSAAFVI
jgi:hypothetical protein